MAHSQWSGRMAKKNKVSAAPTAICITPTRIDDWGDQLLSDFGM
jgi:hypothetical protein